MKKLILLTLALTILIPSLARPDTMTVRIGYYMPKALTNGYLGAHPNSLWGVELSQMSFPPSEFRGSILGGAYEWFLTPQLSFAVSIDTFNRQNGGYYRDYVGMTLDSTDLQGDFAFPADPYLSDPGRFEILHTFHVSMTPIQLSLKFAPFGRKTRFIPYVGGGGGLYFVRASIYGEIPIFDPNDPDYPPVLVTDDAHPELGSFDIYHIVAVNAHETRTAFGGHAFAGIMVPIGYRLTLEAEARYHLVKVNFRNAFPSSGYGPFDMSGLSIGIGLNYWF